ncbi:oligosaccharide flippase family protein [Haladaptatus sp. NG-WS-4]
MTRESSDTYSALQSVSRGASIFVIGKGIDNGLRYFLTLLLTRGLAAPTLFSVYAFATTILAVINVFTNLGTNQSILKFVPQYEDDSGKRRRMLGLAYLTSLGAGIGGGALLYVAAPWITQFSTFTANGAGPYLTEGLRILAIMLPFNTLTNCVKSLFKSLELPEYQVLIENILIPSLRVIMIGIALLLGYQLVGAITATVIGMLLVFAATVWLAYTKASLSPLFSATRAETVEFYNFSLPLTLNQAGYILSNRVDILMVGFLVAAGDAVGMYKIATVLAGFLILPLNAFSQLFPPIASRLYTNGEIDNLESLYRRVTRWSFTMALFPAVGAIVFSNELLTLFGDSYTQGQFILLLFVIAQLTNASVGPSGYLLMMTDHQYMTLTNQWILGLCNVVLNYFLIMEFGLIGAAIASVTVITSVNVLRVAEVWYFERLFPYSRKYFKPILAALVSAPVMYAVRSVFLKYLSLSMGGTVTALIVGAVGGIFGLVAFGVVLYWLGIEKEDWDFFTKHTPI